MSSSGFFSVFRCICALLLVLGLPLAYAGRASPPKIGPPITSRIGPPFKFNFTFETVSGFFLQDLNSTDPDTFDVISSDFGLVSSSAPLHWQAFDWSISELNRLAPRDVSYRVLYIARHGEGFHNLAESIYGTPAWNAFWSKLDGDGNITWGPDALLTPLGMAQARNMSIAWQTQARAGIPLPQSFYVSPLTRATDTLNITWGDWMLGRRGVPEPVIIEGLRETIGVHTCDNRRNESFIHNRYPAWTFEKGFAQTDPFWTPDDRETSDAQQARARQALVEILNKDHSTYISITCHSGETTGLLAAIGHRPFPLGTGEIIPAVIKATRVPAGPVNMTAEEITA